MTRGADAVARSTPPRRSSRRHSSQLTHCFPQTFPLRVHGREEIRAKLARSETRSAAGRAVNARTSRYLLHADADPELSIVLIATVVGGPGGTRQCRWYSSSGSATGRCPTPRRLPTSTSGLRRGWPAAGPGRRPIAVASGDLPGRQCPALSVGLCRRSVNEPVSPHTLRSI